MNSVIYMTIVSVLLMRKRFIFLFKFKNKLCSTLILIKTMLQSFYFSKQAINFRQYLKKMHNYGKFCLSGVNLIELLQD